MRYVRDSDFIGYVQGLISAGSKINKIEAEMKEYREQKVPPALHLKGVLNWEQAWAIANYKNRISRYESDLVAAKNQLEEKKKSVIEGTPVLNRRIDLKIRGAHWHYQIEAIGPEDLQRSQGLIDTSKFIFRVTDHRGEKWYF